MELKPATRSSLVQSVVDQLLDLIKDGSLAPGARLPSERELMRSLHVGRSTIREALRSLAIMNLVDMRPGQGSFIRPVGVESLINPELFTTLMDRNLTADLLEMRKMIEPAGADLAAARATVEELGSLQATLEHCRKAHENGLSTADLSAHFHVEIARAAHNGVLVMFMESILGLLTERGAKLEQSRGFSDWEITSHQEIVDALARRDRRLAHRLMTRHLEESARRLLDDLDSRNGRE